MHYNELECSKCGRCCREFLYDIPLDSDLGKQFVDKAKNDPDGIPFKHISSVKILVQGLCRHLDDSKGLCQIYPNWLPICEKFKCWEEPKYVGVWFSFLKFLQKNSGGNKSKMNDILHLLWNKAKHKYKRDRYDEWIGE